MPLKFWGENWESMIGITNLGVTGDLEKGWFSEVIGMKL